MGKYYFLILSLLLGAILSIINLYNEEPLFLLILLISVIINIFLSLLVVQFRKNQLVSLGGTAAITSLILIFSLAALDYTFSVNDFVSNDWWLKEGIGPIIVCSALILLQSYYLKR